MEISLIEKKMLDDLSGKLDSIESLTKRLLDSKLNTDNWLDIKELSRYLKVSIRTIHSYKEKGILPFSQYGNLIRFRKSDIDAFLMQHYITGIKNDRRRQNV